MIRAWSRAIAPIAPFHPCPLLSPTALPLNALSHSVIIKTMDAYQSGSTSPGAKYRGAVVEDLQLPPAFCLPATAPLSAALEAAYEREFDQLPVLNERRRPIGYLNVKAIKEKFEKGQASQNDPLEKHTTHFRPAPKSPTHPYTVIHPLSPLEDLEAFLVKEEFALERKWVLAVATRGDLETFVKRRG